MSENNPKQTRKDLYKNNKRNKLYVALAIVGGVLLSFVLLYQFFYGSGEEAPASLATKGQTNEQSVSSTKSSDSSAASDSSKSKNSKKDSTAADSSAKKTETKAVASTDSNVEKAYTGDWAPVGTTQTGEHVTNYDDGSADRTEIKQATAAATGINASEMVEWWVGNAGDQQVTTTVSDKAKAKIDRVTLSWIDGKGWQVTQIEELKEIP
jgi:cytoskeletal protein RodZ